MNDVATTDNPPRSAEEVEQVERNWLANIYMGDKLPELTLQVIMISIVLGALMIAFNIYMGLKTGWGEGGSLIAVILGFAIMRILGRSYSVLENNATQTFASAAGSLGNIVNVIPALFLLAADGIIPRAPSFMDILLWVFFTSFLGVFFAIPLRRQILVIDRLRFPTGTACAEAIQAMHATGTQAMNKAKALGITGLVSGVITWFQQGWPAFIPSQIMAPASWKISGIPLANLTIGTAVSPMMFGAGFLIGPRVGASLGVAGIVAWVVIVPWLVSQGIDLSIAASMTPDVVVSECLTTFGAVDPTEAQVAFLAENCKYFAAVQAQDYYSIMVKWLMWPAIGMMIAAGLTATAYQWKVILKAIRSMFRRTGGISPIAHLEVPTWQWVGGLIVASIGVMGMLQIRFGVPWYFGILAIALSFMLAVIAVRATGETDINPVGTMGSVTQIAFGAAQTGSAASVGAVTSTNLLTGGVAAGGASEAADMMQDLKTGWLLGATPKRQVYAQLLGVLIGAPLCTAIFWVLIKAHPIGSEMWPAPAAITWAGLATMMAKGVSALPPMALPALAVGSILGVLITVVEKSVSSKVRAWMPSAIGLGVAMIVPYMYSLSMFLGSMVYLAIKIKRPAWMENYSGAIGAGGIAGEGLIGVTAVIVLMIIAPFVQSLF